MAQRDRFAPRGLFGGTAGRKFYASLNGGEAINVHGITTLKQGDRLVLDSPGGGGFGPPAERAAAAEERDRRNGIVTLAI